MAASRDTQLGVETLTECIRALKRKPNDSDSDDYIDRSTNRGQKLRKRSRFARKGLLGPPGGPPLFRETVEHAGFRRAVISQNPPLIDEDGFAIDSDDDQNVVDEAQGVADASNPWAGIRIDEIKAPLRSVTELSTNPNWNRPYLSAGLDELCVGAQILVKRESGAVELVKQLRSLLCGDLPFAPVGTMLGINDEEMFESTVSTQRLAEARRRFFRRESPQSTSPKLNGESSLRATAGPPLNGVRNKAQPEQDGLLRGGEGVSTDVTMKDTDASKDGKVAPTTEAQTRASNGNGNDAEVRINKGGKDSKEPPERGVADQVEEGDPPKDAPNGGPLAAPSDASKSTGPAKELLNGLSSAKPAQTDRVEATGNSEDSAHLDVTKSDEQIRTGANNVTAESQQSAPAAVPDRGAGEPGELGLGLETLVNRFFLVPRAARPHRDMGLPADEADDIRRLVQLYIQKQEEIDRGTQSLYKGLLWANSRRQEVYKWSKAEAHCGANRDMSDGEDWYDMEEWGLTEELKKGQDEEEEDTNTRDQPKKTRNRR